MLNGTPLERLDAAVQAFLDETEKLNEGRFITGWVLAASTARVDPSPEYLPLVTGAQYALGPQTSTTNAAGLAKYLEVVMERAIWRSTVDDGEDSEAG